MSKFTFFILLFFITAILNHAQSRIENSGTFKVEARKWVKDKPNQPWTFFDTHIIDSLKDFVPKIVSTNCYNSLKCEKQNATGFFRTLKLNDRWWFVDPEGYLNFQRDVNGLREGPSERNKVAFNSRYGNSDQWINKTFVELNQIGFNGVGAWSDTESIILENKRNNTKLSYTFILNLMSGYGKKHGGTYQLAGNIGYPNQCIFVFDPEFEVFCEQYAKSITKYKNDPNLLGYFSDNELPFGLKNLEGYLSLPETMDTGRIFAENWLKSKNITAEKITDKERLEFASLVAERYYRIVSKSIKKYDPNHLFLGSRLHGSSKNIEGIIRAAGIYCDVVSINYYGSWSPDPILMKNWGDWATKPFMITEFYTKAMDSGLANTTGAGFTVHTQQDRGFAYQNFCLGLLKSKNCVGWHWFRYQDNDPSAKGGDPSNLDSNKGLLNTDYQWYSPMIDRMKQLNQNIYSLIYYFDENKQLAERK